MREINGQGRHGARLSKKGPQKKIDAECLAEYWINPCKAPVQARRYVPIV